MDRFMTLRDYCVEDAILPQLDVADKEDAIRQLVGALVAAKAIPKAKSDAVLKEVIERERQASTGIGRGVGIPHARSAHVKQIVLAIGRVPRGVEFGAVDGERVKLILLLVSPKEGNAEHLAAMKTIVGLARDPYQRQRLISCGTAESFLDLLTEIGGPKA
jgi:mannitol/fructose-specific phosphotransferase system IIA component (Ntr-type)